MSLRFGQDVMKRVVVQSCERQVYRPAMCSGTWEMAIPWLLMRWKLPVPPPCGLLLFLDRQLSRRRPLFGRSL